MPAPDLEKMIREDLKELMYLYSRKLPVKVGGAVQSSFQENFRKGRFYSEQPWQPPLRTTLGFRGVEGQYGPLLSGKNALYKSIKFRPLPGKVIISSEVAYAATHNDGDDIGVTERMKRFFWAKHLEHKERMGVNAPETEFWKRMALKKPGSHIKIPRRHFLGPDKAVDRTVNDIINNELENFIKTHNHGTTTA